MNEEEQKKQNEDENVDTAIADTILHYQKLYEEAQAKRQEAEQRVIEMTKALRNMSVVKSEPAQPKEKTCKEILNKLF